MSTSFGFATVYDFCLWSHIIGEKQDEEEASTSSGSQVPQVRVHAWQHTERGRRPSGAINVRAVASDAK